MPRTNGKYDDYDMTQYDATELMDELDDDDYEYEMGYSHIDTEKTSDSDGEKDATDGSEQDKSSEGDAENIVKITKTTSVFKPTYEQMLNRIKKTNKGENDSPRLTVVQKTKKVPKIALSDTDDELRRLSRIGRNAPDFKMITDPYEAWDLVKSIHSKDQQVAEAAKLEMTKRTLPYINSIINDFFGSYRAQYDEDMRNIGLEAIFKHCRKFKPERGKFMSYISNYVRYEIRTFISKQVHDIPVKQSRMDRRVLEKMAQFQQTYGKEPTAINMAMETGMSVACVERIMRRITAPPMMSMDDDNTSKSLSLDSQPFNPEAILAQKESNAYIDKAVMTLPVLDRQVLVLTYGLYGFKPMKEKEVSNYCNIPPAKVNQIQHRALRALKKNSGLCTVIDTYKEVDKAIGKESINEVPIASAEQMMEDILIWEEESQEE